MTALLLGFFCRVAHIIPAQKLIEVDVGDLREDRDSKEGLTRAWVGKAHTVYTLKADRPFVKIGDPGCGRRSTLVRDTGDEEYSMDLSAFSFWKPNKFMHTNIELQRSRGSLRRGRL
jgi:hypothetical protein